MKIAHIAPPWLALPPQNYGGTEIVLYHLIEEQVAQGHDVTVFAPEDARTSARLVSFYPRSLIASGVPWYGHLKAYYHLAKAVDYIKQHDFEIVHTHLSSSADMYLFPLLAHLTTPHVTTLHSCFPFDRVQTWIGDADEYFMEWAPTIPMVAISEHARLCARPELNIIGIVHHGLPATQFCRPLRPAEEFFVWLGRFVPDKGPHFAIEAAKKAGVPLILAGTIDQHIHESVRYFKQEIEPHLDGQQIKYIGPVDMKQKIDLLSRARGLLNPIQWDEPFGMVMIEAMAAGCPIIAFARGAAPEIVSHRVNGFLVKTVDEMVSSIEQIDELDREVVQAHASLHFTVQAMASKYSKVYQTLITPRREKKNLYPSRQSPLLAPLAPPKMKKIDQAAYSRIISSSQQC